MDEMKKNLSSKEQLMNCSIEIKIYIAKSKQFHKFDIRLQIRRSKRDWWVIKIAAQ